MVNSSPEYAITKACVGYQSRKRDRSLRTYGKRPISATEAEDDLSPKRQKTGSLNNSDTSKTTFDTNFYPETIASRREKDDAPKCTTIHGRQTIENAKRSTILNYFKPAPYPSAPKTEAIQIPASFPSSTKLKRRRKPRLLRLRAPLPETEIPLEDVSGNSERAEDTSEPDADGDAADTRDPLLDHGNSLRNQQRIGEQEDGKRRRRGTRTRTPTVQTTLNISTQAAFSECRLCDTVWNPLYPDDVKYHSKQHAAVLRAEKRKLEDEL